MNALSRDCFLPGGRLRVAPTGHGPLDGLSFAVKDLIDVAGSRTGGGNPDWLAGAAPAPRHATVVAQLLGQGAACVGKTITDELAFSLEGENLHYGTPVNPRNPDWLPGGSSSGSAVAVASGAADFALGTDTGGSVRVPAAFCGIFGFRPSHGALSLDGVQPLAPSYDTVGWFTREPQLLKRVGDVLLPEASCAPIVRIAVARDVLEQLPRDVAGDIHSAVKEVATDAPLDLLDGRSLEELQRTYAICQGREIKRVLGERLAAGKFRCSPAIEERFVGALAIDERTFEAAHAERLRFAAHIATRIAPDMAIALPVVSVRHLSRRSSPSTRAAFYAKTLGLTAIAGSGGLPQLQFGAAGGESVGLSLVGARGCDRALLALAARMSQGRMETR